MAGGGPRIVSSRGFDQGTLNFLLWGSKSGSKLIVPFAQSHRKVLVRADRFSKPETHEVRLESCVYAASFAGLETSNFEVEVKRNRMSGDADSRSVFRGN